ncbi:hypothetical protein P167DRAFT_244821 [Morchella conica CCBAS932]|uniref:Uncharacterized protein n=1 Tax=Morchella conica CCBAS932 TaxID=1392247 RepID=A0A3N4KMW7_9PEZI|nr:hypothetical protein P167DRAFT_244821 [Morchella conica CCBAS932]
MRWAHAYIITVARILYQLTMPVKLLVDIFYYYKHVSGGCPSHGHRLPPPPPLSVSKRYQYQPTHLQSLVTTRNIVIPPPQFSRCHPPKLIAGPSAHNRLVPSSRKTSIHWVRFLSIAISISYYHVHNWIQSFMLVRVVIMIGFSGLPTNSLMISLPIFRFFGIAVSNSNLLPAVIIIRTNRRSISTSPHSYFRQRWLQGGFLGDISLPHTVGRHPAVKVQIPRARPNTNTEQKNKKKTICVKHHQPKFE